MSQSPKAFGQPCGVSFPIVEIQYLKIRDKGTACKYTEHGSPEAHWLDRP